MDTIQSVVNTPSNAVASKAYVDGLIASLNLSDYWLRDGTSTATDHWDISGYDFTTTGVATFGSNYLARLGNDGGSIAGYFETGNGFTTVTLADGNRAGEFTAAGTAYALGATDTTGNIIILADQQYAINSVGQSILKDLSLTTSVEMNDGTFALKVVGNTVLDTIYDTAGTPVISVDTNTRKLYDESGTLIMDWGADASYGVTVYNGLNVENIFPLVGNLLQIGSGGDADLIANEIEGVTGFKVNGTQGFTGTGIYVTLTIEGGIITNAV